MTSGGQRTAAAKPPRVVLDTNVVLLALVFAKGGTARLRLAWQAARFVPLVSTETAGELIRVLTYPKFRLADDEQLELLADYLPFAEVVQVPEGRPDVPNCRDPADMPFLYLAAAGRADALVTGDADLLALTGLGPCPILTPESFMSELAP